MARAGARILEIVKRPHLKRFAVLPKRPIVERTLAWISRNRRLMRDFERHAVAVVEALQGVDRLRSRQRLGGPGESDGQDKARQQRGLHGAP